MSLLRRLPRRPFGEGASVFFLYHAEKVMVNIVADMNEIKP